MPCTAARRVRWAQFDERVVADSWWSRRTAWTSHDLARVQYLEGAGPAATSWLVAAPDTAGELSLMLRVGVTPR